MRKKLTGMVISGRNDKTRIVSVEKTYAHPKYGKIMKSARKLHCHDEKNISAEGNKVVIMESKPYSKLKRWVVVKVEK